MLGSKLFDIPSYISVVFFGGMAIGIAFGIAHVGGTLIQVSAYITLASLANTVA